MAHLKKASLSDSGVPTTVTPEFIGQIYVDTATGKPYSAKSLTQGDWAELDGNGLIAKRKWFRADYDGNYGDYRIQSISGTGAHRFTFKISCEMEIIEAVKIVFIPVATIAGGKTVDLDSDYGKVGEQYNNHSESATITIIGTAGELTCLDVSSVFTNLEKGDFAGLFFDLQSIGTTIKVLGLMVHYK